MIGQQGDVLLFQSNDGGEICIEGGLMKMSAGLRSAAYISLFGGNQADDGREGNIDGWWGNLSETDPSRKIVSETQFLLNRLAPVSANLLRIQDAVENDLKWMVDVKAASSITAVASMPGRNRVNIKIAILALGEEITFEFSENWKAAA